MTDTPQNSPAPSAEGAVPVKAPALPYVLHANLKEYGRRLGIWRIVLALALTSFFYFRFGLIVWILSVAGIAFLIGGILFVLSKRSLTVSETGVEFKNAFGRRRFVGFGEIEAVKVFVNYYEPSFGMIPRVSIGIKGNQSPIVLVGMYWPTDELDKLLAVIRDKKVATDYYPEPATYGDIATQFPSYATYIERHPARVAAIVVPIVVIIMVGIAAFMTFAQ